MCCTNCTTTGPLQPATLRRPFARSRSAPRSAISVSMARANGTPGDRRGLFDDKTLMLSVCSGLGHETAPSRAGAASMIRRRIERAITAMSIGACGLKRCKRPVKRRRRLVANVGLRDDDTVGQDDLAARLGGGICRPLAGDGIDNGNHRFDKNSPPSARSVEKV